MENLRQLLREKYGILDTEEIEKEIEKLVSALLPQIEIDIMEYGVAMEAKLTINGLKFITQRDNDTEEEVINMLKKHELENYLNEQYLCRSKK